MDWNSSFASSVPNEPPRTRRLHCAPPLADMMPCVGRIAHCRIECTAGSFDILDDAVTHMVRAAPPSSRGCSCIAIEAKIAAGRRAQGLMMPAGRIALQIARAAATSTVWTRAVSSAAAAAEQQQGSVVQCELFERVCRSRTRAYLSVSACDVVQSRTPTSAYWARVCGGAFAYRVTSLLRRETDKSQ